MTGDNSHHAVVALVAREPTRVSVMGEEDGKGLSGLCHSEAHASSLGPCPKGHS